MSCIYNRKNTNNITKEGDLYEKNIRTNKKWKWDNFDCTSNYNYYPVDISAEWQFKRWQGIMD